MERDFKGVWIPREIWLSADLSLQEKAFLVEIDSLDNHDGCFATNDYFSQFFNLSKNRCSEVIKQLEKKGFVSIKYQYKKGTRSIEKRLIKVLGISTGGIRESDRGTRNIDRGYSGKCEENNTSINNTFNNTNNKDTAKAVFQEHTEGSLLDTLLDFLEMRKQIRANLTPRAANMLLTKLDNLAKDDDTKIKILEQSIMASWKNVYPLKQDVKKEKASTFTSMYSHDWDLDELEKRAVEHMEKTLYEGD